MTSFKSINENSEITLEINKSKFLAFSFQVNDLMVANGLIKQCKQKFEDATHVCYAYVVNSNEKCSDDGEPSGTAGKPMLEIIKKRELRNVLVVVVRYFGGVKLGAGGLNRAYGQATTQVLNNSGESVFNLYEVFSLTLNLGYEEKMFNNFVKSNANTKILHKTYSNYLTVTLAVTQADKQTVLQLLTDLLKRDNFYFFMHKEFIKE